MNEEDRQVRSERRRKRRQERAYQVQGWENLWGGRGSKPVFARSDLASSSASSTRSGSPALPSNTTVASIVAAANARQARISSSQQQQHLNPSMTAASGMASQKVLGKRKATDDAASGDEVRSGPTDDNSDDSDFEILGVTGPASQIAPSKRPRTLEAEHLEPQPSRSPKQEAPVPPPPLTPAPQHSPSQPTEGQTHVDPLSRSAPIRSSQPSNSLNTSSQSTPGLDSDDEEQLTSMANQAVRDGCSLSVLVDRVLRSFLKELTPTSSSYKDIVVLLDQFDARQGSVNVNDLKSLLAKGVHPSLRKKLVFVIRAYGRNSQSRSSEPPAAESQARATPVASSQGLTSLLESNPNLLESIAEVPPTGSETRAQRNADPGNATGSEAQSQSQLEHANDSDEESDELLEEAQVEQSTQPHEPTELSSPQDTESSESERVDSEEGRQDDSDEIQSDRDMLDSEPTGQEQIQASSTDSALIDDQSRADHIEDTSIESIVPPSEVERADNGPTGKGATANTVEDRTDSPAEQGLARVARSSHSPQSIHSQQAENQAEQNASALMQQSLHHASHATCSPLAPDTVNQATNATVASQSQEAGEAESVANHAEHECEQLPPSNVEHPTPSVAAEGSVPALMDQTAEERQEEQPPEQEQEQQSRLPEEQPSNEDDRLANLSRSASVALRESSAPSGVAGASNERGNTRPKRSTADRMKRLLGELADVTRRPSSFNTIQALKESRKGTATDRTVPNLVENWQHPANMIPWTCIQELPPTVLHARAERHLNLSLDELIEKVYVTRSVDHLVKYYSDRFLVRALMEFPRVPHMLEGWLREKDTFYRQRGMEPPTDTIPEFAFAEPSAAPLMHQSQSANTAAEAVPEDVKPVGLASTINGARLPPAPKNGTTSRATDDGNDDQDVIFTGQKNVPPRTTRQPPTATATAPYLVVSTAGEPSANSGQPVLRHVSNVGFTSSALGQQPAPLALAPSQQPGPDIQHRQQPQQAQSLANLSSAAVSPANPGSTQLMQSLQSDARRELHRQGLLQVGSQHLQRHLAQLRVQPRNQPLEAQRQQMRQWLQQASNPQALAHVVPSVNVVQQTGALPQQQQGYRPANGSSQPLARSAQHPLPAVLQDKLPSEPPQPAAHPRPSVLQGDVRLEQRQPARPLAPVHLQMMQQPQQSNEQAPLRTYLTNVQTGALPPPRFAPAGSVRTSLTGSSNPALAAAMMGSLIRPNPINSASLMTSSAQMAPPPTISPSLLSIAPVAGTDANAGGVVPTQISAHGGGDVSNAHRLASAPSSSNNHSQRHAELLRRKVMKMADGAFGALVADCLSFAEHVAGSGSDAELDHRTHFSKEDVEKVLGYVISHYSEDMAAGTGGTRGTSFSQKALLKLIEMKGLIEKAFRLTNTLTRVKASIVQTFERSAITAGAEGSTGTKDWQNELLRSGRYMDVLAQLFDGSRPSLPVAAEERKKIVEEKVTSVNRELEHVLEKMTEFRDMVDESWSRSGSGIDDGNIGPQNSSANSASLEMIRKEFFLLSKICCKYVVNALGESSLPGVGGSPSSHSAAGVATTT